MSVKKKNNRRVVNLNKPEFDKIKEYCNHNALNMCRWLEKIALEKIEEKEK